MPLMVFWQRISFVGEKIFKNLPKSVLNPRKIEKLCIEIDDKLILFAISAENSNIWKSDEKLKF